MIKTIGKAALLIGYFGLLGYVSLKRKKIYTEHFQEFLDDIEREKREHFDYSRN